MVCPAPGKIMLTRKPLSSTVAKSYEKYSNLHLEVVSAKMIFRQSYVKNLLLKRGKISKFAKIEWKGDEKRRPSKKA